MIFGFIAGFLLDNENAILYFYCDDINEINRRNHDITPQKYRSRLFSRMSDRDIYIHIISRESHLDYANIIRTTIEDMEHK